MQILITGGAGRLGRSVVSSMAARGHEITVVDVVDPGPAVPGRHLVADLTDAGQVFEVVGTTRPDAIIHLAGLTTPFGRPEHVLFSVNAKLAFEICQAATLAGTATVIAASSPTVIGYGNPRGWAPVRLPIDEDHPLAPWHAYATSKVVVEAVVRAFAVQAGDDTRFFAFRPCYVVAPEEWQPAVATQQGHTMRQRLEDPALAAPSVFNYVDARDVSEFLELLVERAADVANGETFFVGAADALTTEPVATVLARFYPAAAPMAAALGEYGSVFSNDKARRLLGWAPQRTWRQELR